MGQPASDSEQAASLESTPHAVHDPELRRIECERVVAIGIDAAELGQGRTRVEVDQTAPGALDGQERLVGCPILEVLPHADGHPILAPAQAAADGLHHHSCCRRNRRLFCTHVHLRLPLMSSDLDPDTEVERPPGSGADDRGGVGPSGARRCDLREPEPWTARHHRSARNRLLYVSEMQSAASAGALLRRDRLGDAMPNPTSR